MCNNMDNLDIHGEEYLKILARKIRSDSLKMVHAANASHIGSCLSIADILAVLYGRILRVDYQNPGWANRDRFILSKGHAAAVAYAVLAEQGFFPLRWLDNYCKNNSHLGGHLTYGIPGVEISTGSLGHGLPVACGMALACKKDDKRYRVFVILSDGDCNEGSTWEAALFGAQHHLDNLITIIDYNKIQAYGNTSDVLNWNH
jgi:transketolase